MKPILEIQSISKRFNVYHEGEAYLSLRDRLIELTKFKASRKSTEDFWALKDVSFDVMPGESIGIIGKNGAGKSTLLKILSKITPPTQGKIVCRGRIASLLEVGTGFHPELTGRENVYLNGSILGMKKREIDNRFDEIVDFAGTERFLDTPLKHYSSGMQLRLAFSVAAFLEPEILIIDEVLAVGDAEFQKKCLGKMEDVTKEGRTIIFVSHNLAAIENLCSKAILMNEGKVLLFSKVQEVVNRYQSSHVNNRATRWERKIIGQEVAYFSYVEIEITGKQPKHELKIVCGIKSQSLHKDAFLAFDISNSFGVTIFQAIPKLEPFIGFSPNGKEFVIKIFLPPLIPDQYAVSAWMGSHNTETICWDREIVSFEIVDSPTEGRNFPHSHHNGFMVPKSEIIYD